MDSVGRGAGFPVNELSLLWVSPSASNGWLWRGCWAGGWKGPERRETAAMAAFRTCAKGGLIPHARHGGTGVWALAEAASKLDGMGLE